MSMFTRSRTTLAALVVLALAIPAGAAEVNKFLPDDTDAVLVLNVKQLLNSPLVQKHALEELKTMLKGNSEATKHLEALGFDPFKDLTSITLAVCITKGEPKALMIAQGDFDMAKFEHKAEDLMKEKPGMLKVTKEGKFKIYELKTEQGGDKPGYFSAPDSHTIVASNQKEYVVNALGRSDNKRPTIKKEVEELITKADANQSLWFAVPGSSLLNSDAAGSPDGKKFIEKLDSVRGGVSINRDVKMAIDFVAKGADGAKELAEMLQGYLDQAKGLLAVLAGDKKELAAAVGIIESMKVETSGNNVSLKAEASESQLEKSLKK